jgi:hypothetical protein
MLELAYWIDPHLGVWNPAQDPHWNLAQYRDRRTTGRNEMNMRDKSVRNVYVPSIRIACETNTDFIYAGRHPFSLRCRTPSLVWQRWTYSCLAL